MPHDDSGSAVDGAPRLGQDRREPSRVFDPALAWLGLRNPVITAGVHITSDNITLVVMEDHPLRLVAIGRAQVRNDAVVGNEIRLVAPVAEALSSLVVDSRLAPGCLTIAAVEPVANSFTIWEHEPQIPTYNVFKSTYDRIQTVVDQAGLTLERVDLVPAAMARLGRAIGAPTVAGRAPTGWTVTAGNGFTDAKRSDHGTPAGQPLPHLAGIRVPRRLASLVDPANDSVALGAALAGFGHQPLVSTQAVSSPLGPDWVVQQITSKDHNQPDHQPTDLSARSHGGEKP